MGSRTLLMIHSARRLVGRMISYQIKTTGIEIATSRYYGIIAKRIRVPPMSSEMVVNLIWKISLTIYQTKTSSFKSIHPWLLRSFQERRYDHCAILVGHEFISDGHCPSKFQINHYTYNLVPYGKGSSKCLRLFPYWWWEPNIQHMDLFQDPHVSSPFPQCEVGNRASNRTKMKHKFILWFTIHSPRFKLILAQLHRCLHTVQLA